MRVGEGMRIGTDVDILLSSFKATDTNHETPEGTETRAGLGFSKQNVFPSQGCETDRYGQPGQRSPWAQCAEAEAVSGLTTQEGSSAFCEKKHN